jgi:hypothetical protein
VTDLDWSTFGRSEEFTGIPVGVYWLANLVIFGFGEEIGSRGFLQPELEERHPRVLAASLAAIVWASWHLPLFGITPSYRAMPAIGFVGLAAGIRVASWRFAWLLEVGRGSLPVTAVFHAWFDISTTSPLGPSMLPTVTVAGITVIGLLILRHLLVAARAVDRLRPEHASARLSDQIRQTNKTMRNYDCARPELAQISRAPCEPASRRVSAGRRLGVSCVRRGRAASDDAHLHVHVLRGGVGHGGDEIDRHLLDVVDAAGSGGADTGDVDHPVVALADGGRGVVGHRSSPGRRTSSLPPRPPLAECHGAATATTRWLTSPMVTPLPEPDREIDPDQPVPDDPAELLPDAPDPLPPPPIESTPDDPGGDPAGVPEPA